MMVKSIWVSLDCVTLTTIPVCSEIEVRPSPKPVHLPEVRRPFWRKTSGVRSLSEPELMISDFVRMTAHSSGDGADDFALTTDEGSAATARQGSLRK